MSGQIPDHFVSKDDDVSVSSMGDSAYQSQPDATRRGTDGFNARNSQDAQGHMFDPFLGGDLYSPALSSEGQSGFHATQSDMNQMLLPPSAGDSDQGNDAFAMSDFTNYSVGQGYGPHRNSSSSHFFPSSNEMDTSNSWAASDIPTFTAPFAVRPVDANALLPFRQQQQRSRDGLSQRFYPPLMFGNQDTQNTQNSTFSMSMNVPQARARARRPQLDTSSISDADALRSSTPQSTERRESRRASVTDQIFQSFVMSPTSSVMSLPHRASVAESDFTEQSSQINK